VLERGEGGILHSHLFGSRVLQVVIQVPQGVQAGDTIQVSVPRAKNDIIVAQAVEVGEAGLNYTSVQAIAAPQHQQYSVEAASGEDLAYAEKLLRSRSWVSCFAILDLFLVVLSIFSSLSWWGLLLLIGPLYGYYGANNLNPCHVMVYLVFKAVQCVIYIAAIFAAQTDTQVLWAVVLALCEVYITVEVVKFYRILKSLDSGALARAMNQLQQHRHARMY